MSRPYIPGRRPPGPPRINRARTPSPPRRYNDRGYDSRDRAVDDQWRGPVWRNDVGPRGRDWDRDWRRNDRFREESRSTPASAGHSPPDRIPRSPPRNGRFAARTPPLSTSRVPSGSRSSVPAPWESRDSKAPDGAIPGPGPSTIAQSTPSSVPRSRSLRGSSSPVDLRKTRPEESPSTAPSRMVPLPKEVKQESDTDLEEGEVVSPVRQAIPPWERRNHNRQWERDRDRGRGRERSILDRELDADRERDRWGNRSFRPPSRNSQSPQKRRSRSPPYHQSQDRKLDARQIGHSRARSNSIPTDYNRLHFDDGHRRISDPVKRDPVEHMVRLNRPATPDGPPPEDENKQEDEEKRDALQTNIMMDLDPPNRPLTPLEPPPTDNSAPVAIESGTVEPTMIDTSHSTEKPLQDPPAIEQSASPMEVVNTPAVVVSEVNAQDTMTEKSPLEIAETVAQEEPAKATEVDVLTKAAVVESTTKTALPEETSDEVAGNRHEEPPGPALAAEDKVVTAAAEEVPAEQTMSIIDASKSLTVETTSASVQEANGAKPEPFEMVVDKVVVTDAARAIIEDISMEPGPSDTVQPKGPERRPKSRNQADARNTPTPAKESEKQSDNTTARDSSSRQGKKNLPTGSSSRITIAERRAIVLPPTNAQLSSPFSDKLPRRDPRPTAGSMDTATDVGPRTNDAEFPPTWDEYEEEERLEKLLIAIKAAQQKSSTKAVDIKLSGYQSPVKTANSRIDHFLTDSRKRDARIKEYVEPLYIQQRGMRHLVHLTVHREQQEEKAKMEMLRLEYQELDALWKKHCDKLDALMEQRGPPPADLYAIANPLPHFTPALAGPQPDTPAEEAAGGRRGRRNLGDAVQSEADFEAILADLAENAAKDPTYRASKTSAVVPDMLPDHERRMLYDDDNDLVTDPLVFYDFAGRAEPIWTDEERAIFLKRYLSYPKQFGKIADGLEFKSAGECVAFYYRTKKEVDYKGMLASRRGDKKRRSETVKKSGQSALLADLDRKKPTVESASTPGPRSAITPARRGEDGNAKRGRPKDSGTSTPTTEFLPRRKRLEDEDGPESSTNPSRAGSETPSVAKARMRLAVRGPKRPRVSSVTEVPTMTTITPDTPTEVNEPAESNAAMAATAQPDGPAELLPPVKRAMKRRKVDPNDPNAIIEEKEKDPNKPSRRAATNSYWSVEEKKRFRELVVQYGNDPKAIAAELKGKSERQVSNFFDAHKEDMKLDELAKGGEEAMAELRKMHGAAEAAARPSPFAGTLPSTAPYARSIYDVYPGQRRSDAFDQRFAEPRLGMFPPTHQANPPVDSKPLVPRSGGMRISALLNDEPTASADQNANGKTAEMDAASDGTVSERDAEGGVKRPSPQSSQPPGGPFTYARVASGAARPVYETPRRPSETYDRDAYRSSTAQPSAHYETPSGYYPPPPRAATTTPGQSSWDGHTPRAYSGEYARDPYYAQQTPSRSYPPPPSSGHGHVPHQSAPPLAHHSHSQPHLASAHHPHQNHHPHSHHPPQPPHRDQPYRAVPPPSYRDESLTLPPVNPANAQRFEEGQVRREETNGAVHQGAHKAD